MIANETMAMFMNKEEALKDRKLFVHNLGEFFQQTRDEVISMELDDNEIVTITYKGGGTHTVNVNMDSYTAIVRDVAKMI